jgi:glyoxylase-like metal-dependent hydrolase (beta-lactamase superfamily II)
MAKLPDTQVPGLHHRRIGDILVSAVSDGFLNGSNAVLQNISADDVARMLTEAFRPTPRRGSVNTFLVRSGGRTALIDTGCGPAMQASAGQMFRNLAAAGVDPAEIDTILMTHLHPDHSNGLTGADGQALFPNAELALHAAELAYWDDPASATRAAESGQGVPYFAAAQVQLAPYRQRLRLFEGGEVFPGVTAMPLHGHTPGHTGYAVASGEDSLLIWGDIVHVPELQLPRPEIGMQFDVDPELAVATRRRVFDMVVTDRLLVTGMHLHFPGLSHLVRQGEGYVLVPEARDLAF